MRFPRIMIVMLLSGCSGIGSGPDSSHSDPGYYGGDGTSEEQAILAIGIYQPGPAWIAEKYPGSTVKTQESVYLSSEERYDLFTIQKADGETVRIWFRLPGRPDADLR